MRRKTPIGRQTAWLMAIGAAVCVLGCAEANPLPTPGGPPDFDDDRVGEIPADTSPGREPGHFTDASGAPDGRDDTLNTFFARQLVFLSSLGPDEQADEAVVLVGAPASISHEGVIRIERDDTDASREIPADPTAGFAAVLDDVQEGTVITLTLIPSREAAQATENAHGFVAVGDAGGAPHWNFDRLTAVVKRITGTETDVPWLAPYSDVDTAAPEHRDPTESGGEPPFGDGFDSWAGTNGAGLALLGPDDEGMVQLVSEPGGLTPYATLLVFNATTGAAHKGDARNDGSIAMRFPATSGDDLTMFAANPNDPTATTRAFSRIVP